MSDKIIFPRHQEIDYTAFAPDAASPEARYGLPTDIQFCSRCVMSNQRPHSAVEFKYTAQTKKRTTHLDEENVCAACRWHDMKEQIDWEQREKELVELLDSHRRNDGKYDVLVPGSGGKDSFFVSHILREKYGMHPLTVTWAPHIYTDWGWKNFQAWIHAGFDNYLCTPNGAVHRLLTRLATENLFHPFQPFIIGQKLLAPRMAELFDIPLVFFGENEAEYGNNIDDNFKPTRDISYFTSDDPDDFSIGGISSKQLVEDFGLAPADLQPYKPMATEKVADKKMEIHFFSYYHKWHPQNNYYYVMEHSQFQPSPERTSGTYSKYSSIDDRIDDFHYYCTFIKFGIGRATYDAAHEVRNGDLDRDEGVALVKRFDGEYPERFADEVFTYLSVPDILPRAAQCFEQPKMDRDYFEHLTDRFRSPHLWMRDNGTWKLRKSVVDK